MLPNMWKSSFILVSINLIITIYDHFFTEKQFVFSYLNQILGLINILSFTILSVYLIYIVKEKTETISIFSYVWRAFIALFLTVISSVFLKLFLGIETVLPSIENTLILSFLQFLSLIVIIWLFYSTNRKMQLVWLSQIFRTT